MKKLIGLFLIAAFATVGFSGQAMAAKKGKVCVCHEDNQEWVLVTAEIRDGDCAGATDETTRNCGGVTRRALNCGSSNEDEWGAGSLSTHLDDHDGDPVPADIYVACSNSSSAGPCNPWVNGVGFNATTACWK